MRGHRAHRLRASGLASVAMLFVFAAPAAAVKLDPSFGDGGTATTDFRSEPGDEGRDVLLQRNGKVIVVGSMRPEFVGQNNDSGDDFAVARYDRDGSLDRSFSRDGKRAIAFRSGQSPEHAYAGALQPNGKIVLAGEASSESEGGCFSLVRLNRDGSLDRTFSGDGRKTVGFDGYGCAVAYDVAVQPDGKLLAVGQSEQWKDWEHLALARLNRDGSLDPSFAGDGLQTTSLENPSSVALAVTLGASGEIVVAGASYSDPIVARYLPDGELDAEFADGGVSYLSDSVDLGPQAYFADVEVTRGGRIVAAGGKGPYGNSDFLMAAYRSNGDLDTSFSDEGVELRDFSGGRDAIQKLVLQPGGALLAIGSVDVGFFDSALAVARYRANGAIDGSFARGGLKRADVSSGEDVAYGAALQPNGKLLLGGTTGEDFAVARLTKLR